MKNATAHIKKLEALLRQVRQAHPGEAPPARDPVTHLVIAFLQWDANRKSAEAAYHRLLSALVDNNDLRVSHGPEIVHIIGPRYPKAQERAARLHDSLQAIFVREHAVSLDFLVEKSKKEARAYLDSLPGITSYVASYVLLHAFGGACLPVDNKLVQLLLAAEVIDPSADAEQVASFIEKQVKPGEMLATHLSLQDWADSQLPAVETPSAPPQSTMPPVAMMAITAAAAPAAAEAAPAAPEGKRSGKPAGKTASPASAAKPPAKAAKNSAPAPAEHKKTTKKSTKSTSPKAAGPAPATTKKTTKKSTKKTTKQPKKPAGKAKIGKKD